MIRGRAAMANQKYEELWERLIQIARIENDLKIDKLHSNIPILTYMQRKASISEKDKYQYIIYGMIVITTIFNKNKLKNTHYSMVCCIENFGLTKNSSQD